MDEGRTNTLLEEAFYNYANQQLARVEREGRSFVHYTSAEAALSMINNREIWLRNAAVMNDFSEMAHGEACLRYCLLDDPETVGRSKMALNSIVEGLHERVVKWFFESSQMRRIYTYLISISEHGPVTIRTGDVDEESTYGRLSMWRAYGSRGGVAMVFSRKALSTPNDAVPIYSSPVFYGTPSEFAWQYAKILAYLELHRDEMKRIDPAIVETNLTRALHFACLSCKHPGFREEREWRITYSADPVNEHIEDAKFNEENAIQREFRIVNGLPQRIYKMPFVDVPEKRIVGFTLPDILERVIVGPTQYPMVVADALHSAMRRIGFDAHQIKISLSDIPLRT